MWLFTPDGFFSAVEHKDDPTKIMVRARARLHAENLVKACPNNDRPKIVETPPPADYRYRVTVRRETWGAIVAKYATDIRYLNFKNEAHKRRQPSGFMNALHGVWSKLLSFQDSMHEDSGRDRWGGYATHQSHRGGQAEGPFGLRDRDPLRDADGESADSVEAVEGLLVWMDEGSNGEGKIVSVDHEQKTALVLFETGVSEEVALDALVTLEDPGPEEDDGAWALPPSEEF